jgi:hypothetical protein
MTKDGRQSAGFVQWKGEFPPKGDMQVTDHIELLLRFTDPGGDYRIPELRIKFKYIYFSTNHFFTGCFKNAELVGRRPG